MNLQPFGDDKISRYALTALPVLAYLLLSISIFNCTLDDAFISFRYASNLAHGKGLVFNTNERIEGFSNPLWVLVLSLFQICGADIVVAAKLVGVACGVLSLYLTWRISRRSFGLSPAVCLCLTGFLATNISFVYYAISGMETVFYLLCVLAMIGLLMEDRYGWAALFSSVLVLTRPEGILFAVPLILGLLQSTPDRAGARKLGMLPGAVYLIMTILRWQYYGHWLPNTYAAKVPELNWTAGSLLAHSKALVGYTLFESSLGIPMLLLFVAGAAMLAGKKRSLPLAAVGCMGFFVWLSKGDWTGYWRFYLPVLPLIVIFSFAGLDLLGRRSGKEYPGKLIIFLAALLLVPNAARTAQAIIDLRTGENLNPAMHSRKHIEIGRYLGATGRSGDKVVVNEIGAIGYYSGLAIIDMLGLTDRNIPDLLARNRLDEYASYIMNKNPAYILLNDKQTPGDAQMHPLHAAILKQVQATGLYKAGPVFALNSFKNILVFVRKDPGLHP
jgi:arabinofuranosyltransferase